MTPPPFESYREILLSKGQVAIVDADDYEWLNQWKWSASWSRTNSRFYAVRKDTTDPITKHRKRINMHAFILGVEPPLMADHLNHNPLDNRRKNLRLSTDEQNRKNRRKYSNNRSGYKGVSFSKRESKWVANLMIQGKYKHLGYFESKEDAAHAYDEAARINYGEFACLNFPHD